MSIICKDSVYLWQFFMFFDNLFCSNMILLIYVAQHTIIVGYCYFVIKFWIILYLLFSSFYMERQ